MITADHVAPILVGAVRDGDGEAEALSFDRDALRDLAARFHALADDMDVRLVNQGPEVREELMRSVYRAARRALQVLV